MKKLFLILHSVFCILNSAFAQVPSPNAPPATTGSPSMWGGQKKYAVTGKITGTIIDSVTKQPVEFATITLTKKNWRDAFNGTITDGKGNFKLEKVIPGTYTLTVSFVGYKTKTIDTVKTTNEKMDASVGKIHFAPSSTDLTEVVIQDKAPLIENKVDRLVYNAEQDVSSKGGNAADVLRKVPMLNIDADGNVQLRGNSKIKILINGKPSGMLANNVADALKAIPSDQIKSVEVITSPSAKYDAEGTAGIVNIITKKNNMEGMNGSVNATGGTRNNSLGANLNVKKGRRVISSSLFGQYILPNKGYNEIYNENTLNDSTIFIIEQKGDFNMIRNGFGGSLGIDYDFNAYHNLSSNINVFNFNMGRNSTMDVNFTDNKYINSTYSRTTDNLTSDLNIDWNLDYRKSFKEKKEEEWTTSILFTQNSNGEKYELEQSLYKEKSLNEGVEREGTLQTDYVLPVKKKVMIETGAKAIVRNIFSNYQYDTINQVTSNFEKDLSRTDNFNYLQGVYSGYFVMGYKIKDEYEEYRNKYEFKGGLRYEFTDNQGEFSSGIIKVKNNYHNLFPSIIASRIFDNFSNLKLSYNKRLQRPGLYNLNPFINTSDPQNVSTGNPYLLPEVSHTVELGYGKFAERKSYNISLYYSYTDHVIQDIASAENGVSTTTFKNIGFNNNAGINLYGQLELWKDFYIRGSGTVYYLEQKGVDSNQTYINDDIQYNIYANCSWEFGKDKKYTAEVFGIFNSPRLTLQGKVPSFSFMFFGASKKFWKKKASLGFQLYNPFNEYLKFKTELNGENFKQHSEVGVPFRSISITFSYSFGKMEFNSKEKGVNNDDMKKQEERQF